MANRKVGLLGATSFVGDQLIRLLAAEGVQTYAFSRRLPASPTSVAVWRQLTPTAVAAVAADDRIEEWVCVAPIWVLPEHFALFEASGARRIVALSSTSRFTKTDSSDAAENAVAKLLIENEERLQAWAQSKGIEWVILRPTLIYGLGQDKNIAEIARFIRRFGFFPLFGKAMGLRQPIHVEDVASACIAALNSPSAVNHDYNISGGETLSYREMVGRVFGALQRRPRMVTIPLAVFELAVACVRVLPRYRRWSAAMAERMNRDMVFDHGDATRDFGFSPRPFLLGSKSDSRK